MEVLLGGVALVLILVQALLLFNVAFYAFATVGALLAKAFPRQSASVVPGRTPRIAVVTSAHDEERVIRGLITSLQRQSLPPVGIFVVADRCTDQTARIARLAGATVFERREGTGSKGAALRYLWEQLGEVTAAFDAVAVMDADNVAEPGFLQAVAKAFEQGAQVVQGQRVAKNPDQSPASALDGLAEAVHHRVIAAGLSWWGLSTTISGSGVVYARDLFARLVTKTRTQVEDCEWQLCLMEWGIPIRSSHLARVYDEKIPDFEAMARQRSRWVQGKLHLFAAYFPRMAWGALNGRRGPLEGTCYLLTMVPRSVLVVSMVGMGVLGALGLPGVLGPLAWLLALGVFAMHIATGLLIDGARASEWRSLLKAPLFIRAFLAACARALGREHIPWVRTPHGDDPHPLDAP